MKPILYSQGWRRYYQVIYITEVMSSVGMNTSVWIHIHIHICIYIMYLNGRATVKYISHKPCFRPGKTASVTLPLIWSENISIIFYYPRPLIYQNIAIYQSYTSKTELQKLFMRSFLSCCSGSANWLY